MLRFLGLKCVCREESYGGVRVVLQLLETSTYPRTETEKGKKCGRGRIGEEDGCLRRSGRVGSGREGQNGFVLVSKSSRFRAAVSGF
ncbi:hypothetical protein C4D60_Mb00t07280 [Musa balbisiana]|uniref:Uncharacterized protein n=1 Tax=Musa balbisiana TaxID=52838 RepID=A0A4S8I4V5_MUSBA|nr:hypothetical protein C4D60_Mb00t07280 [Musa balbisiana]